jgi:hypothetical protein
MLKADGIRIRMSVPGWIRGVVPSSVIVICAAVVVGSPTPKTWLARDEIVGAPMAFVRLSVAATGPPTVTRSWSAVGFDAAEKLVNCRPEMVRVWLPVKSVLTRICRVFESG